MNKKIIFSILTASILAGCGSSSDSEEDSSSLSPGVVPEGYYQMTGSAIGSTVSTTVVYSAMNTYSEVKDGYLTSVIVFSDYNFNGRLDTNEPQGVINEGKYYLNVESAYHSCVSSSPIVIKTNDFTLSSPPENFAGSDAKTNVTPITTSIWNDTMLEYINKDLNCGDLADLNSDASMTLRSSISRVTEDLKIDSGVSNTNDLYSDYLSSENIALETVANEEVELLIEIKEIEDLATDGEMIKVYKGAASSFTKYVVNTDDYLGQETFTLTIKESVNSGFEMKKETLIRDSLSSVYYDSISYGVKSLDYEMKFTDRKEEESTNRLCLVSEIITDNSELNNKVKLVNSGALTRVVSSINADSDAYNCSSVITNNSILLENELLTQMVTTEKEYGNEKIIEELYFEESEVGERLDFPMNIYSTLFNNDSEDLVSLEEVKIYTGNGNYLNAKDFFESDTLDLAPSKIYKTYRKTIGTSVESYNYDYYKSDESAGDISDFNWSRFSSIDEEELFYYIAAGSVVTFDNWDSESIWTTDFEASQDYADSENIQ